jgi:hypothetical protein
MTVAEAETGGQEERGQGKEGEGAAIPGVQGWSCPIPYHVPPSPVAYPGMQNSAGNKAPSQELGKVRSKFNWNLDSLSCMFLYFVINFFLFQAKESNAAQACLRN